MKLFTNGVLLLVLAGGLWMSWDSAKILASAGHPEKTPPPGLSVQDAFPNLSFIDPVELTHPRDGTNRLFVLEQAGYIRVFDRKPGTRRAGVFLDIHRQVASGGEMGLMGLAFHPDYERNGYFYVNYTANNPRRTVVSRFKVSTADANRADPGSEQILLTFDQPYANHNGGKVTFGPDGYLYIGTGDGGSGGDPQNNGQNLSNLLGKILRIDVDHPVGNLPYGIPVYNPFVGRANVHPEIYAYGLRNPWRFSFDAQTGELWAGDVGQNKIEEVDLVTKGWNYGWRLKEAGDCYNPARDCETGSQLIDPVSEYSHDNGDISITGATCTEAGGCPLYRVSTSTVTMPAAGCGP